MLEREALEAAIREFFGRGRPPVVCVYLFGSRARGVAGPASDVDLGVLLEQAPHALEELPLDLEAELEQILGLRVQIVPLNEAPADLVHRVLRDGRLLVDRDPVRRVRFEVRRRNEFFDLQPVLEQYRAARIKGDADD